MAGTDAGLTSAAGTTPCVHWVIWQAPEFFVRFAWVNPAITANARTQKGLHCWASQQWRQEHQSMVLIPMRFHKSEYGGHGDRPLLMSLL